MNFETHQDRALWKNARRSFMAKVTLVSLLKSYLFLQFYLLPR